MPNFIFQFSQSAPKESFFGKLNQDNEKFFHIQRRAFDFSREERSAILDLTKARLKQTLQQTSFKAQQNKLKPLQVFRPCISVMFADCAGKRHSIVVQEQNGQYLVFISGLGFYSYVYLGEIEVGDN